MKKILGSLLFLALSLYAKSEFKWTVDLKDKELYLHESTVLTMQCKFEKEGKNDDVEFTPPENSAFSFDLLSEKRHFNGELQTLTYKYLVFAKEVGHHKIALAPTMLFTTQSAIDNVIEGRDNVNDLEVDRKRVNLNLLLVDVSKTKSSLTGTLDLKVNLDLNEVSAYEPVHLEIQLQGEGNLHDIKNVNFDIEGVEVFADKVQSKLELSPDGYKGVWLQRFAFVGAKDFIIPSVTFSYFDLNDKKDKVLKTKAFKIKIKKDGIERKNLIDEVNLPSSEIDFSKYLLYVYYVLTFLAGFIVAKLIRFPKRKTKAFEKGEKIKKAKGAKELLEVLILCDKSMFEKEIKTLEEGVYKKQSVDISSLKKQALSRLT